MLEFYPPQMTEESTARPQIKPLRTNRVKAITSADFHLCALSNAVAVGIKVQVHGGFSSAAEHDFHFFEIVSEHG
jgi:hypothetical protein